jgi:hypothetical protein
MLLLELGALLLRDEQGPGADPGRREAGDPLSGDVPEEARPVGVGDPYGVARCPREPHGGKAPAYDLDAHRARDLHPAHLDTG